jgi:hypothetical protein
MMFGGRFDVGDASASPNAVQSNSSCVLHVQDYCRRVHASDLKLLIPQYDNFLEDPAFHVPALGTMAEPHASAPPADAPQPQPQHVPDQDDVRCWACCG